MTLFDSILHRTSLDDDLQLPSPNATYPLQGAETCSPAQPKKAAPPAPSRFTPWLLSLAYPIFRYGVIPFYFRQIEVVGQEHLPHVGPVILAPTHRSRWDAFLIPYAAGYTVTRRHLRFMVTADEMVGLQGWFIRRVGGFPIDTKRPAVASLRHGVDLLQAGEALVIFPEGDIFREGAPLKQGLARLALQAEGNHQLGVKVVPIHVQYSHRLVPWRTRVRIRIGEPLLVADYKRGSGKQNANRLITELEKSLHQLSTKRVN